MPTLFDPIKIGDLELNNRIIMAPLTRCRAEPGRVPGDLIAEYYAQRADAGLIISEATSVTPMGVGYPDTPGIWSAEQVQGWKKVTDAVHAKGGKIVLQLWHVGRISDPLYLDGQLPVAPSALKPAGHVSLVRPKKDYETPRALEIDEIPGIIEAYRKGAENAKEAGFDGVEIHGANGYLLDQFYSPLTNRRTDEYGAQTIENRTRFLRETLSAVRSAIGSSTPLAVRLGGADYAPGGATEEDAVEACRLLEAAGADLLDISGGMCSYVRPGHPEAGYFGSMTEKIKAAVSTPVLLTGGVTTRADAERLLAEQKADLIGVGRALFKDAHWREHA